MDFKQLYHRVFAGGWRRISSLSGYVSQYHERKGTAIRLMEPNKEIFKGYQLTSQQKKEIKKLWKGVRVDYDWFRFFNSIQREKEIGFDARFIPMDFSYTFLHPFYNNTPFTYAFDDKNMYDLYFHDFLMPRTICRVIDKVLLDANYNRITREESLELCNREGHVIIKPADFTASSGRNILFWDAEQDNDCDWMNYDNCIVQEVIKQHPDLAMLHKFSINTIRMLTFYDKDGAKVLGAVVRTGANGSKVDNASQGGLFCGINDDGSLMKYGYTRKGQHFESHPSGTVFANCHIPNYEDCVAMVTILANRLVKVARLIAWDLAIDENGNPLLIEVNLPYSAVDLLQITNGPLFGNQTEEIIKEVMSDRKNRIANRFLI